MELVHSDSHFDYLGYGVHKSYCDLEIWNSDDKYCVILTETSARDSGTSVTNACEGIATHIYGLGLCGKVHPDNIVWIEHYTGDSGFSETYDQIKLEFQRTEDDEIVFANPTWNHIGEKLSETTMIELMDGDYVA